MSDLLQVRDLCVEFPGRGGTVHAVDGISFRVAPGSTVAIVGESGSGKSVMAQAILGILPHEARLTRGEILFRGIDEDPLDLAKLDPDGPRFRQIRGGRISMIFQEPMTSLSPLHTIGDQIGEALALHRPVDAKTRRKLTEDMLHLVGFPEPERAFDAYPFELSGGLRQRAMIAMALICRPPLLIADEPTTALDVTIQAQILKQIKDIQAGLGMAVLIITHDLGVVANVADEVVVVYKGRVVESGMLRDVFEKPEHPYLRALLAAVPRFDMKPGQRLVPLREIRYERSALLGDGGRKTGAPQEEPLLSVESVGKSFTTRKCGGFLGYGPKRTISAVTDVSFVVRRGECLGLVGESGCGKTTVSKMIMGATKADTGRIIFNDGTAQTDLLTLDERALKPFRRRIQYVFQDPFSAFNPRMPVSEILTEPLTIHGIGRGVERSELAAELMRLVGLDPRWLVRFPHSFSGGQRQRIGIARALALQPDLIICDEPVSALDVSVQAQVLNLLKDLQADLGLTLVFISHNLAVVDYIADRIAVMCAGRIVEIAPREILFRDPVHPYTRALLTAVPYPDPDRKLDLSALMEGRASVPSAWPAPFTAGSEIALLDLGDDHFVRATTGADPRERWS